MITGGNVRGSCIVIFIGPHGATGSFSHFYCLLLTIMPLRPFTGTESTIRLCACDIWSLSNFYTEAASELLKIGLLLVFARLQSNADAAQLRKGAAKQP
jgi:hypothetical protein